MICTISSPKETVVYHNVTSIVFPTISGQTQVLSGHAKAFFLLSEGDVILNGDSKHPKALLIHSAHCFVDKDQVKIIL